MKYTYTVSDSVSKDGNVKVVAVDGVKNEEQAEEWLNDYSELTKTTWRVRMFNKPKCRTVIFRVSKI